MLVFQPPPANQTVLPQSGSLLSPSVSDGGLFISMVPTDCRTWSVDTPEDLARVARLMEGDDLMKGYSK